MKRLRKYLLNLDIKDTTYKAIYQGAYAVTKAGIVYDKPGIKDAVSDPVYWQDDISYTIERSNKFNLDVPSITISFPLSRLGIEGAYPGVFLSDYLLRQFSAYVAPLNEGLENKARPVQENGHFYLCDLSPVIVARNACRIVLKDGSQHVNMMILAQLPRKNHKKASKMLCKDLPGAVDQFIEAFDLDHLKRANQVYDQQEAIRDYLKTSPYCAFIANGSLLPRLSASNLPDPRGLAFESNPEDEIQVCDLRGLGIKKGVTVITGGGYSGKSTLLDALGDGIYNHIMGDGREFVITDETAVHISAEDGRAVNNVDISPYVKWLPKGSPKSFTTSHASGSTSQAANIVEALEAGNRVLLIDEDKSATNFMMRDGLMNQLIHNDPLVPFTDHVRDLYRTGGVSTILVVGSSSEYLAIADTVLMMANYRPANINRQLKSIQLEHKTRSGQSLVYRPAERLLETQAFTTYPSNQTKEYLEISDLGFLLLGNEQVDIRKLRGLVSKNQVTAIAFIIRKLSVRSSIKDQVHLKEELDHLYDEISDHGIDFVYTSTFMCSRWLDLPRKQEVLFTINRMRHINFINPT